MYGEHVDQHARDSGAPRVSPSAAPVAAREADAVKPPPRGGLREEQKKLTRHRVLDAAVTVFAEKGFVGTTMEDIARAAGVTRVTVYAHFPGKGDIIEALAQRVYDTMDEVYAALAGIPRWTRAAIRKWLDDAVERWQGMVPIIQVVLPAGAAAVAHQVTSSRNKYVDEHERYVDRLLGDAERGRGVPLPQARQRAMMVVLQSESFLTTWIAGDLPMATDDPLDLLVDSLCHLLGPALEK